jgi:hypothetical protein
MWKLAGGSNPEALAGRAQRPVLMRSSPLSIVQRGEYGGCTGLSRDLPQTVIAGTYLVPRAAILLRLAL